MRVFASLGGLVVGVGVGLLVVGGVLGVWVSYSDGDVWGCAQSGLYVLAGAAAIVVAIRRIAQLRGVIPAALGLVGVALGGLAGSFAALVATAG